MHKNEATCTVSVKRFDASSTHLIDRHNEVKWIYTIQGIPLSVPVKDSHAPILECRARERLEEKLEISFTGGNVKAAKTLHY